MNHKRRVHIHINPVSVVFAGFLTCLGALFGNALIGLTVALGIILIVSVLP